MSTSFGGAYGDYEWEITGRTLRVIARGRGVLKEFGPVFVTTDEQAQYAAQGRIDLNREELEALRRGQSPASGDP
ncbi:MAG: hypothetical protein F4X99_21825 [Gammaproteobacteria bacterium]|nr:hypothetical protein [Gammaproteobacteria bacterium]